MISRALFDLAARGFAFPKPDALRLNREYRLPAHPTVRIRALRAFYAGGKLLGPGDLATVPLPDALDAEALRRAERI